MNLSFLKHPRTGLPDVMLTLSAIVVITAAAKFLLDGATATLFGHTISFGHVDSSAYATLLTPVLGAHGYTMTRPNTANPIAQDVSDDSKT